jgi:hypothetical protein
MSAIRVGTSPNPYIKRLGSSHNESIAIFAIKSFRVGQIRRGGDITNNPQAKVSKDAVNVVVLCDKASILLNLLFKIA